MQLDGSAHAFRKDRIVHDRFVPMRGLDRRISPWNILEKCVLDTKLIDLVKYIRGVQAGGVYAKSVRKEHIIILTRIPDALENLLAELCLDSPRGMITISVCARLLVYDVSNNDECAAAVGLNDMHHRKCQFAVIMRVKKNGLRAKARVRFNSGVQTQGT